MKAQKSSPKFDHKPTMDDSSTDNDDDVPFWNSWSLEEPSKLPSKTSSLTEPSKLPSKMVSARKAPSKQTSNNTSTSLLDSSNDDVPLRDLYTLKKQKIENTVAGTLPESIRKSSINSSFLSQLCPHKELSSYLHPTMYKSYAESTSQSSIMPREGNRRSQQIMSSTTATMDGSIANEDVQSIAVSLKGPKVFAWIRTSPGTENDGKAQALYIKSGCKYLLNDGVLPEFDTHNDISYFIAKNECRRTVVTSPTLARLVDSINVLTDDADDIIVVLSSLDRIGVEDKIIQEAKSKLTFRPNIRLHVLNEYGLSLDRVSTAITTLHRELHRINDTASHVCPAKQMKMPRQFQIMKQKCISKAIELRTAWSHAGGIPDWLISAKGNGDFEHLKEAAVVMFITNVKRAWIMSENIEVEVGDLSKSPLASNSFNGKRKCLIYTRVSRDKCRVRMVDDLPERQLSMCVSYLLRSDKISSGSLGWVIFDKNKRRSSNGCPGFARTIAMILEQRVSDVIISRTNRIASDWRLIFFVEVCKQMGVTIHSVEEMGLDISSIAELDMQWVREVQLAHQAYNDSIKELVSELDSQARIHYDNLQKIGTHVHGYMMKNHPDQCAYDSEDELENDQEDD